MRCSSGRDATTTMNPNLLPFRSPSPASRDCGSRFNETENGRWLDTQDRLYPYCYYENVVDCQSLAKDSMIAIGWEVDGSSRCSVIFDKQDIPDGVGTQFCPGSAVVGSFNDDGTGAIGHVNGFTAECYVCT